MRKFLVMPILTIGTLLIGLNAAGPATALDSTPTDSDGIYVVTVGAEGIDEGILHQAAIDPGYRAKAQELARTWSDEVATGSTLKSISDNKTSAQVQAALASLSDRLAKLPKSAVPSATMNSTQATQVGGVQALTSGNPNTFPVIGTPGGDRSYWQYLSLAITGQHCTSSGCTTTDKITCTNVVGPGATSTVFNWNCGYFPNAGNFGNKHFDLFAVNRGSVTNSTTTGNLFTGTGGSAKITLGNGRDLHGNVLTSAVALWAYFNPLSTYYEATGKTSDATCRTGTDNRCFY